MNIDTSLNLGNRYAGPEEPDEKTCYCGETFNFPSDEWEEHIRECEIRKAYEC